MQQFLFKIIEFENYDGDTFTLRLDVGFSMNWLGAVRISGVDTPEMRGGTDLSKAAGRLAKEVAAQFVDKGMAGRGAYFLSEALQKKSMKFGKYGRPLGDIYRYAGDTGDTVEKLTVHLVRKRLAVPYYGGAKRTIAALHEANLAHLEGTGILKEYL